MAGVPGVGAEQAATLPFVFRASRTGAALAALLFAALLAAPGSPAAAGSVPAAMPDDGGVTPMPRKGSELASKRGIGRTELRRRLASALRSVGGASGAYVVDTDAPRKARLYALNGSRRLIPASNQKLFTTAAFLDRLGARGRLRTVLHRRGKLGPAGAVLRGDLMLVGDGDPAFGTSSFARGRGLPVTPISNLVKDVARSGVVRVTGDVRVDPHIFDGRRGVAATGWNAGPYLSPLSGLAFNSGFDGSGYSSNPAKTAGRALKRGLQRNGVKVKGGIGISNASARILAQEPMGFVRSPMARTLIAATNKPSNNFFAEMLLKRVAANPKKQGTTTRGARKVERFAKSAAEGVRAADGSGLGRSNEATPRQVTKLLIAMRRHSHSSAFRKSLPLAGREGTLAGRMRGTAAEGRCRAKTGTLSGVSALSGYCSAGRGTVAFSILMNGVDVNAARSAQDRMAAAIARYG